MEKEAKKLVAKLVNHQDINHFSVYKSKEGIWTVYYSISGQYLGNYFSISIKSLKIGGNNIEINGVATKESEKLKTFLEKITTLKFKIS